MNRTGKVITAFLFAGFLTPPLFAGTVQVKQVGVNARVGGLQFAWLNRSDNFPTSPLLNFSGASFSAAPWSAVAPKYLKICVNLPNPWELKVMTNNFSTPPDTQVWGTQYGGLIRLSPPDRIGLGWWASASVLPGGPPPADPGADPNQGWLFVKDIRDADFAAAAGYTTIAFGDVGYTNVVRPNAPGNVEGLAGPRDLFYLYLNSDFNTARPPDPAYTTVIQLDLIEH